MTKCRKYLERLLKKAALPKGPDERIFLQRHLSDFADTCRDKVILDAGAGGCQYAYLFKDKNKYESCDLEKGFHTGIEHDIVSTIYNIPRSACYYDIVLMLQVLEHLEFPVEALKEIRRITKDNGVLFISVPQAAGDHYAPDHYFNYTQYGLKSVLRQAGFETIDLYRLDGMFRYVGNRMQKLGSIVYYQYSENRLFVKVGCLTFMSLCFWIGFLISKLDFMDHRRHYCIGIIAIAQKRK